MRGQGLAAQTCDGDSDAKIRDGRCLVSCLWAVGKFETIYARLRISRFGGKSVVAAGVFGKH